MSGIQIFEHEAARYDAWFDSERGKMLFASEVLCLQQLSGGLPRPWLEFGVGIGNPCGKGRSFPYTCSKGPPKTENGSEPSLEVGRPFGESEQNKNGTENTTRESGTTPERPRVVGGDYRTVRKTHPAPGGDNRSV